MSEKMVMTKLGASRWLEQELIAGNFDDRVEITVLDKVQRKRNNSDLPLAKEFPYGAEVLLTKDGKEQCMCAAAIKGNVATVAGWTGDGLLRVACGGKVRAYHPSLWRLNKP